MKSAVKPPDMLVHLQTAMAQLLWQKEGHRVLADPDQLQAFLDRLPKETGLQVTHRERLQLYESLIYFSVEDTARSIYPVCYQLLSALDDIEWEALVELYRRIYPNPSHQMATAVQSFPRFLTEQAALIRQFPYLAELAEYEWVEVALARLPQWQPVSGFSDHLHIDTPEALKNYSLIWNPDRQMLNNHYRVAAMAPVIQAFIGEAEPNEAGNLWNDDLETRLRETLTPFYKPTQYVVYRTMETSSRVRFFELNPLTVAIIQMSEPRLSIQELLVRVYEAHATMLAPVSFESFVAQALHLFADCYDKQLLVGCVPVEGA